MFCILSCQYKTGTSLVVLVVLASCKMNHIMRSLVNQICIKEQSVIRKSAETVKYNHTSDDGPEFLSSIFVDFLAGRDEYLLE